MRQQLMVSDSCITNNSSDLYEVDFYAWTQQQSKFLQEKIWNCLDIPNLVEEIESLGKQERQELTNRLGVLLGHLLKWEFQSGSRSRSWFATIREQRRRILRLLEKNPSLKSFLSEVLEESYQDALDLAVSETDLKYRKFPQKLPYELEKALDFSFFPGARLESDQDLFE